jgi:hypothetical protein
MSVRRYGARSGVLVQKPGPENLDVVLKFGGGLHTRASEDEIDAREAADGANFVIDFENRELRNRPPFDLIGTVPNASEIKGGASLLKSDGTVSFLIQAGTAVYEWNGVTTFTSKGTVNTNAKLRGHWDRHNFTLDDVVLITDLSLVEPVLKWDGTTLSTIFFTDETGGTFGSFYAKYCVVSNERAIFSACRDSTTNKHMIVGSERGDFEIISVAQRPASALAESDPFFLLTPDLKPINGHVEAFGTAIFSTEKGRIFSLTGSSAKDFAFTEFYAGSSATGDESLAYIGNDIIYGRPGRIESVRDTDRSGDSESDDLSAIIATSIQDYDGWKVVYNSRLNRVYIFPDEGSEVWVYETAMREGGLSPWMRWTTSHPLAFQPTFVMSMLDPADGLEYVFMGDENGKLYRLEGSGDDGDGGSYAVATSFLSKMLSAPLNAQVFNVEGWIKYRKQEAAVVELRFEYAGESIFSESLTITIPEPDGRSYYAGGVYYDNESYFSSISGKLSRQPFFIAGQANDFQIRVICEGNTDFVINEIGLRFAAAST